MLGSLAPGPPPAPCATSSSMLEDMSTAALSLSTDLSAIGVAAAEMGSHFSDVYIADYFSEVVGPTAAAAAPPPPAPARVAIVCVGLSSADELRPAIELARGLVRADGCRVLFITHARYRPLLRSLGLAWADGGLCPSRARTGTAEGRRLGAASSILGSGPALAAFTDMVRRPSPSTSTDTTVKTHASLRK